MNRIGIFLSITYRAHWGAVAETIETHPGGDFSGCEQTLSVTRTSSAGKLDLRIVLSSAASGAIVCFAQVGPPLRRGCRLRSDKPIAGGMSCLWLCVLFDQSRQ